MSMNPDQQPQRLMPAEWEPHEATWIAWPYYEPDWPGKLDTIGPVYAEIVQAISQCERVEILCHDEEVKAQAISCLDRAGNYRLHVVPNNRSWLRDSAPTSVRTNDGRIELVSWRFNGWAKYDNYQLDALVPQAVQQITGLDLVEAQRSDNHERLVLEGGAIDTDGAGTLLTTEECLLSETQQRNPCLDRVGYERAFAEYLGIRKTIWLGKGCAGDDTHGHIDDLARFVASGTVVAVCEPDPADENHEATQDNLQRLLCATDAAGRKLKVITLPMPKPVYYEGERLPASYANFYIANKVVLVPTFNDPNDSIALNTLADVFSDRRVVGINSIDLVWGLGTLHCLTQQQPK